MTTVHFRGMEVELAEQGADFLYNQARNAADAMVRKHGLRESRRQAEESLRKRGGQEDSFDRGFLARLAELEAEAE